MKQKRLFLDMDGTIARFHDNILDGEGHVQIELMYESGFFRKLEPFQNMIDGMKLFVAKHPEVEVFSLSAAQHGVPPGFLQQKDEWLDEYLPEIDRNHRIYPECGVPKSGYIPGGVSIVDYLIDDYNKNLKEWVRDGGKSIKCKNNINHKGTGKFGGDIGNLWTGDMVSNLDTPEGILYQLEELMELEHKIEKPFNVFKTWFEEETKHLPEPVIENFELEKERFLDWIEKGAEGPLRVGEETATILRKRIDEFVREYGRRVSDWTKEFGVPAFGSEAKLLLLDASVLRIRNLYQERIKKVERALQKGPLSYVYDKHQKAYLMEHVSDIVEHYYDALDACLAKADLSKETILPDTDLFIARAISSVAEKEMLVITAYPVRENYPAVEIDISRRDLERVLKEVYKDNPVSVEEFLSEYIWDNGDQIKDFLECHPDFCQDGYKVTDFAEAKYAVTITDFGEKEDGNVSKHTVATFYPEKIDKEFEKMLLEKGYEGYHILVSGIHEMKPGTLIDGVLDPWIHEEFQEVEKISIEKGSDTSLDGKIREATGKCDRKDLAQTKEKEYEK